MTRRKPPLHGVHAASGAKFTEFGGWEMPVHFGSIVEEHETVRGSVGVFDVSHMGELAVSGPDATALTQRLTTNDVTLLSPGEAQYTAITDADGVILDDAVVYRRDGDPADYLLVPNAGHDAEMTDRWTSHRDEWDLDAAVENVTEEWAMLAVQGPEAVDLVAGVADGSVRDLPRFSTTAVAVAGVDCLVARTGYTGEDGVELLCPWDDAETVYDTVDCPPVGLGARDTLRTEMGFLLSGQDFDPEGNPRTPYEAGIDFTVALDTEFVGRDALERVAAAGVEETFVGLRLLDRGVPRHGHEIVDADGDHLGDVTSGTMSPTLSEPIALGYLPVEAADPGTEVRVVVRDDHKRAEVVSPPFVSHG